MNSSFGHFRAMLHFFRPIWHFSFFKLNFRPILMLAEGILKIWHDLDHIHFFCHTITSFTPIQTKNTYFYDISSSNMYVSKLLLCISSISQLLKYKVSTFMTCFDISLMYFELLFNWFELTLN